LLAFKSYTALTERTDLTKMYGPRMSSFNAESFEIANSYRKNPFDL